MNKELESKVAHYKREVSALNKKVESLTENKKILEDTCIQQQHELNKLRSKMKRILEIGKE